MGKAGHDLPDYKDKQGLTKQKLIGKIILKRNAEDSSTVTCFSLVKK